VKQAPFQDLRERDIVSSNGLAECSGKIAPPEQALRLGRQFQLQEALAFFMVSTYIF
jgi:hypothetical protein